MENIVIATIKDWNIQRAYEFSEKCRDYMVWTITDPDKLRAVHELNPKYIFFPHWSWIIPADIYKKFECIAFHIADLPYGRGGSPLQNLIMKKIYDTAITAFKVDDGIDTGPVYLKIHFDISEGSAQKIYNEISETVFNWMIPWIIRDKIKPISQTGTVLEFKRRKPHQSNLDRSGGVNLKDIYDDIRMVDAEGYPRAYLNFYHGLCKVIFSDAKLEGEKVTGKFEIVNA